MNKATFKMHSRVMRLGYNKALNCDFSDIGLASSLIDNDFCQVLWNLRFLQMDLLAYYAKFNINTPKRHSNQRPTIKR